MVYWIVSLPISGGRRDRAWELLQERTTAGHQLSTNFKLEVPELRVGTLDTLLSLSDDVAKINIVMENTVNKIRRTITEMSGPESMAGLKVDNVPAQQYLTRFKWDEPKYPSRRPLKETVDKVMEIMTHLEDDLKVKTSEYNAIKSQLSALARKAGGSLAVRDIAPLVKPQHLVDSENLTTMFVVVSKYALKEWEACYESLSNFVVPRSSKLVAEDNDYALVSVVLFKRVLDDFKQAARSRGYQTREYTPPREDEQQPQHSAEQLRRDVEAKKAALELWCRTAFGEAFSCWLHVLVIRTFVESILRYGLPPAFQAAVIRPADKTEARLRAVLADTFGTSNSYYKNDEGSSAMAGMVGETELYPYVSLTLNVDL